MKKLIVLIMLLFMVTLSYSAEYTDTITINASEVAGDLTDFPVLITGDSMPKAFWSNTVGDGSDIWLEDSSETKLKRELVSINPANKTIELWVKTDVSASVDTILTLYYGDSSLSEINDTDTWDSDYVGVWHADDGRFTDYPDMADSTANGNDGTGNANSSQKYEVEIQSQDLKAQDSLTHIQGACRDSNYYYVSDVVGLYKYDLSFNLVDTVSEATLKSELSISNATWHYGPITIADGVLYSGVFEYAGCGDAYDITVVNQGTKTFTIAGEHASDFSVGENFGVGDSTGNNNVYTVASVSEGGTTAIIVEETIPDDTADGTITINAYYGTKIDIRNASDLSAIDIITLYDKDGYTGHDLGGIYVRSQDGDNGIIYISSWCGGHDGFIYKYDLVSGAYLSKITLSSGISSQGLVVTDNHIFVTNATRWIRKVQIGGQLLDLVYTAPTDLIHSSGDIEGLSDYQGKLIFCIDNYEFGLVPQSVIVVDIPVGKIGEKTVFDDGSADRQNITHAATLNITDEFTFEFWFNATTVLWGPYKEVFVKDSAFTVQTEANGELTYRFGTGGGFDQRFNWVKTDWVADTWYYCVLTYNKTDELIKFYTNGILEGGGQACTEENGTNSMDMQIGGFSSSGYSWPGSLDEVRISGSTRTADWIETSYNNQSDPGSFMSIEIAYILQTVGITNGSFTGSAYGWDQDIQWEFRNNAIRGYANSGNQRLSQDFGAIYHDYYDLTYTVKHNSLVGTTTINLASDGVFGAKSAIPSTVGTHTIQYQATNSNPLFDLMFKLTSNSTSGYIELDDISVVDSDKTAPTPDPSTFSSVPTYIDGDSVEMTATTATDDVTDVEYYFAEANDGSNGGDDSGWQSSPYYMDDGLDAGRTYTYTVQVRDAAFVKNLTTASSGEAVIPFGLMNGSFTGSDDEWSADTQWVYGSNEMQGYGNSGQEELAQDFGAVLNAYYDLTYTVVANTLVGDTTIDLAGSGCFGLQNSIDSSVGTHTIQLQATNVPATLDLTFKMNAATSSGSIILDDIIIANSDKTTPDPDPATFSLVPTYLDGDSVHMHATPASDDSGPVEYYFNETSGESGGDDSGWQTSTDYVDIGLTAGKTYTYSVQSRDSALSVNTGTESSGEDVIPWGLMNGNFTGNADEWTLDAQWAYGSNNVVATGNSGTDEMSQDFGAILNEWYRLKYTVTQNSLVGNATINLAATGCFGSENSIASNVGTHYMVLEATNVPSTVDLTFILNSNTSSGTITLEDISISRNLLIPAAVVHGTSGGYRGRYSSRSSD